MKYVHTAQAAHTLMCSRRKLETLWHRNLVTSIIAAIGEDENAFTAGEDWDVPDQLCCGVSGSTKAAFGCPRNQNSSSCVSESMPNHVKLVEDHLIVSYIRCRELCPEWLLASAADHFFQVLYAVLPEGFAAPSRIYSSK